MWSSSKNADQVSKLDEALAEERAKKLKLELENIKLRSEVRAQLQENHKIRDLVGVLKQEQKCQMEALETDLLRSEANNDKLEAALLSRKADLKQQETRKKELSDALQQSDVRNFRLKADLESLKKDYEQQETRKKELSDALQQSEANNDGLKTALQNVKQTASTQSSPTGVDAVGSGPGEPVHVVPPRRKRDFRITDSGPTSNTE
jgi:chromosome segregation ATPase